MLTLISESQNESIEIDQELFNECGFSVDQLMELAGHSVATVVAKQYPLPEQSSEKQRNVIVCCGPGNNGGDGLVASRHLKLFGYSPLVVYPKPGKGDLAERLVKQCNAFSIPIVQEFPAEASSHFGLIIDAIFGFSFNPPVRPAFFEVLEKMKNSQIPIVSVDVPSGWNVESGPPQSDDQLTPNLEPDCLISLTAPKKCAEHFKGSHWLGGRFVPDSLQDKYELNLPRYESAEVCVRLTVM